MCKYCDIDNIIYDDYYSSEFGEASTCLVTGDTEEVSIVFYHGRYCLRLSGSSEEFSDSISYCPFCGKEFNSSK